MNIKIEKKILTSKQVITNNATETKELGKALVKDIHGGDCIFLYGELGAGKTTFTQGIAEGLGIRQRVISPTFIIVREYALKVPHIKFFYHIDLYRISGEQDIKTLGLDEIINNKDSIVIIEWPQKLGEFLPKGQWSIYLEAMPADKRKIIIEKNML